MILILALLYSVIKVDSNPAWLSSTTNLHETPFRRDSGNGDCLQLRSTWDILWSCLCTIFACTWVSIHPNSPGLDEKKLRVVLRRLELMVWTIVIPEMIIYWALRQWLGARRIADFYKDFGWTRTHGHFLQMGGFVLADNLQDLEVITDERFYDLLDKGSINFPNVTGEQIQSLSKGDGLSKLIVIGQTSWFIAQCISRAIQGLRLTELELVTLAFAFLNGFMYFLWWDKPLDAEYLIRVYLSSSPNPVLLPAWRDPYAPTTILLSQDEPKDRDTSIADGAVFFTQPDGTTVCPFSAQDSATDPTCPLDRIAPETATTDKPRHTGNSKRIREIIVFGWTRLSQMRGSRYTIGSKARRIPTFYAIPHRINIIPASNLVIAVIGVMFGAIHCAGWNLGFPTRAEKIIWRINAVFISTFPILMILHAFLLMIGGIPRFLSRGIRLKGIVIIGEIFWKCLPFYFLARIFLLLEAFITLRDLPTEAFQQVEWTRFLPHI